MIERHVQPLNILKLFAVFMLLAINGCAGVPAQPVPFARSEANRMNERGLELVTRGNPDAALAAFGESYRLYAAVEFHPGMVASLINSARTATGAAKYDSARKYLDAALKLIPFTPGLASEIYFEQSRLLLREGNIPEAAIWGERAGASSSEETKGRVTNLLAEIRLKEGKTVAAENLARSALNFSKTSDDRREIANSLRLLGEIAFKDGRFSDAESHFSNALEIDKQRGLSIKIGADLQWLARTAEALGKIDNALEFWDRASKVSLGGGDVASAVASLERLASLHERIGDAASAESVKIQLRMIRDARN